MNSKQAQYAAKQIQSDKNLSYTLIILGSIVLINTLVTLFFEPSLKYKDITNTRWINVTILVSGIIPFIFPFNTLRSAVGVVVTNVISFCISTSCAMVDLYSWADFVFGEAGKGKDLNKIRIIVVHNCTDLVVSVIASFISFQLIINRIGVSPVIPTEKNKQVETCGILLLSITLIQFIVNAWEKFISDISSIYEVTHNFTKDEICWFSLNVTTGMFMLFLFRNNCIVRSTALVLSGIAIYPNFYSTWAVFGQMTISYSHSHEFHAHYFVSFVMHIAQLITLFSTFYFLTLSLANRNRVEINVNQQKFLKFFTSIFSFFAFSLFCVTTYNVYSMRHHTKIRVSDLKLNLLAALLACFTAVSSTIHGNLLHISTTLVFSLLVVNSLYSSICRNMFPTIETNFIEINGDSSYFTVLKNYTTDSKNLMTNFKIFEESLLILFFISAVVLFLFLISFCKSTENRPASLKHDFKKRILLLGVTRFISNIFYLALNIIGINETTKVDNIGLIAFTYFGSSSIPHSIFQIFTSLRLSHYPLLSTSLLIFSSTDMLDILTRIDSKDHNSSLIRLSVHLTFETASIFLDLFTIACLLHTHGIEKITKKNTNANIPLVITPQSSQITNGFIDCLDNQCNCRTNFSQL